MDGVLLPSIAGVAGTACMSLFTMIAFRAFNRPYRVVKILGNMLRFKYPTSVLEKTPAIFYLLATMVHYAIGAMFGIGYWYFLYITGSPSLPMSFLYGVIISLVAMLGWRLFFRLHPGPPKVDLRVYLKTIGLGHMLLTLVMFLFFSIMLSGS
jgi:hypothetical protein